MGERGNMKVIYIYKERYNSQYDYWIRLSDVEADIDENDDNVTVTIGYLSPVVMRVHPTIYKNMVECDQEGLIDKLYAYDYDPSGWASEYAEKYGLPCIYVDGGCPYVCAMPKAEED